MLETIDRVGFARDGFAVVPHFKTAADIAELRARAEAIVEAFDPSEGAGTFSTRDDAATRDAYFLGSAATVRCFFEEEAFDERGRLAHAKALSINKIGHAMHDLDPAFERFSRGAALDAIARDAGLRDPRVYQSMYIFKQPRIGGEVRWHQDATYFATEPETVTTFWFALEAATVENGCLWVEPGGHRGPLRERFVASAGGPRTVQLDAAPWPAHGAIPLEVEAGTLVVLHGLLPHYSAPNRSARSRHAYTLHAVDGGARYAGTNWLQRPAHLPARGFV
jgi:phytanoyl-CoA hydroxylase